MLTIYPYKRSKKDKTWVFDDKDKGLKEEAFVAGMSEIITGVVHKERIKKPHKGFKATFSDKPFDHDIELSWFKDGSLKWDWEGKEYVLPGNWYHTGNYFKKGIRIGWLCPALLKYFDEPPQKLYVKVEKLPKGIDPIWHDAPSKFAYVHAA